jgi:hypothetical protein
MSRSPTRTALGTTRRPTPGGVTSVKLAMTASAENFLRARDALSAVHELRGVWGPVVG